MLPSIRNGDVRELGQRKTHKKKEATAFSHDIQGRKASLI